MHFEETLQWFESHPDAKPIDLPESAARFMRGGKQGEIPLPADFLVKFYIAHLKQMGKPIPRKPADFNDELLDQAQGFFDYVASRCTYFYLHREEIVRYEDPDLPLLKSDVSHELKADLTPKGVEHFKKFQEAVAAMKKEHEEAQAKEKK